jgi:hypothetical protein
MTFSKNPHCAGPSCRPGYHTKFSGSCPNPKSRKRGPGLGTLYRDTYPTAFIDRPSSLGPLESYEVLDTRFGRRAKPDYAIQHLLESRRFRREPRAIHAEPGAESGGIPQVEKFMSFAL